MSSVKKTKKLAACALISALSLIFMLVAYFPYFTYCSPLVAGAVFSVIVIEFGSKWALAAYFAVSVLSLILCEKEAALIFIGFFGFYPIVKAAYEKINSRFIRIALKFLTFNVGVIAAYLVIIFIFGIPLGNGNTPVMLFVSLLLAGGNVMFAVYDIALSKFISYYYFKLHSKISKIIR